MVMGLEEAARRGLGLLTDEQIRLIDLDTLDIGSSRFCVLGQLYGSYLEGKWALGLNGRWDVGPGVAISETEYHGFISLYWGEEEALNSAWRKVITEYLAG